MNAQEVIQRWGLQPHPEGGYYRELYRSPLTVTLQDAAPTTYAACTHIYWVLQRGDFSAWHRVRQGDELWHWYGGDALEVHTLSPEYACQILSATQPCVIVPAGVWQAARLVPTVGLVRVYGESGVYVCPLRPRRPTTAHPSLSQPPGTDCPTDPCLTSFAWGRTSMDWHNRPSPLW
jgi:hypothetical protein